jgi:sulfate permease, SulP family
MRKSNLRLNALAARMPILNWLPQYRMNLLRPDLIAGITLATFILPESMAYATLAGLPAHFGIYSCLAGGLLFALFTSSKHVAVGPTSSISLMIGATAAGMAGGDMERFAEIAGLVALTVAGLCFLAYVLKLSSLVNFISNSILLGFKAGAALSIISTQLPALFGIDSGGTNFFLRIGHLVQHWGNADPTVLLFGGIALLVLFLGDKFMPGKPVSLLVVIASIIVVSLWHLSASGIQVAGLIPGGLPPFSRPSLHPGDAEGVIELAFACFLVGYIETISAARTLGLKNGYEIDPHQELLSLGFANLFTAFGSGYVVAGGLSQSTVNEKSGARTPMSLLACSVALALILIFFTGLLTNLPMVVLAAIVIHAVISLIRLKELDQLRKISGVEFSVAMIALAGVLVLGILKGVMLAVLMSLLLLLRKASLPHVAELGRIDDSDHYSDMERHPENLRIPGMLILRVESPMLYFNVENILANIRGQMESREGIRTVVLDMSVVNFMDVAGSVALLNLAKHLKTAGVKLELTDPLSEVRDILRKQGVEEIIGHISRQFSTHDAVLEFLATHQDQSPPR